MATPLDLQEQEQLESIKHFWKQYGNLITWVLILALGGFAAFNGWTWYQRERAGKASVLFDELDRAVQAGDAEKTARVFGDMQAHYASTTFAAQAGLLAARVHHDKGQFEQARGALAWVAAQAPDPAYQVLARLRLAGVLMDEKKLDEALAALPAVEAGKPYAALVDDRRGDILHAQGKAEAARAAWQAAYKAMDPATDYRRLVDAKLTSLGAPPDAAAASASAPAAASASAPATAPAAASAPATGASK